MINRAIFKREVNKLVIEFTDKGFTMPQEKAEQWFELMESLTEYQIAQAVKIALRTSRFAPTMSDIYSVAITLTEPIKRPEIIRKEYDER